MDEPNANTLNEAPQGTTEAQTGAEQQDYSNMSLDELQKLIQTTGAAEPEASKKAEAKETPQQEAEQDEETPEDLRDKSPEELIKTIVNLRKLKGRQDQELGELRKFKKQMEELQKQAEEAHVSTTAERLVQNEITRLSEEEKERFYEAFVEDPIAALQPILQKALRPLLVMQAKQQNEAVIRQLKEKTKDSLVPFDEEAVNKIIHSFTRDGRNELFDRYGSQAFEVAYDIYFKQELPKALERKIQEEREKAKREALEEMGRKGVAYTEPPGLSGAAESRAVNYEDMSLQELEAYIRKLTK